MAPLMPDAAFVSPNAPEPCAGGADGAAMAPAQMRAPEDARGEDERWRGVAAARPALDAFLDAELARLGLDKSRLALVGFSQGSMMALHIGLRRRRAPGGDRRLFRPAGRADKLGEAKARNAKGEPPPILLVHGDQDPVIPFEAMFAATDDLARAEIPNQWHLSFGIGHGIDGGGLRHGGLFLAQSFRAAAREAVKQKSRLSEAALEGVERKTVSASRTR